MTEEEKDLLLEKEGMPPIPEGGESDTGVTQAPADGVGGAPAPSGETEGEPIVAEPAPEPIPEPVERTFTQEEVNAIVGKVRQEARAKAREEYAAELRGRYGVEADSEIDDLVGNGQRFDALNGEYEGLSSQLTDVKAENALLKSGVPEEKFDDVKAILAYKHLDVTPENIANELATHPEWSSQPAPSPAQMPQPQPPQPVGPQSPVAARPAPSVVQKLGGDPMANGQNEEEAKAEILRKMFGR